MLADPSLLFYSKHLDDQHLKGLRWHMLTLLAVVTGEAFDRVLWHVQATLEELEVGREDQQAVLAAIQARRDEVVTFEERF